MPSKMPTAASLKIGNNVLGGNGNVNVNVNSLIGKRATRDLLTL